MRVVTRHEAGPRRPAIGSLAISLREERATFGQTVDVRSLENFVAIAGQGSRSQIIRDDEEDIRFLCESYGKNTQRKERTCGERFHMGSMMLVLCRERQAGKAKKIGFLMPRTKLVVLFVEPFEKSTFRLP